MDTNDTGLKRGRPVIISVADTLHVASATSLTLHRRNVANRAKQGLRDVKAVIAFQQLIQNSLFGKTKFSTLAIKGIYQLKLRL
jgi:hypothetical protein